MKLPLNFKHITYRLICFLLIFIPQIISADNSQTQEMQSIEAIPVMPILHVEAMRIAPTTGMSIIDKEMIKNLPSSNGNLTDLLIIAPGIQFSENFESSTTGGEIKPAEVSIAGGRTEDNNYILDGAGNNSLLDPVYNDVKNADNIPGHSQELFILDHLIDNIKVLRANIPVRYGGFSGGVVEVETIDPGTELGGKLSYNTTYSTWGEFHTDPDHEETFYSSGQADNQPVFTKYRFNTHLNLPLSETTGVLVDYSLLHSRIPLELIGDEKVQYRKNENVFFKFIATPHSKTELKLSATYAPYEGTYYLKDTVNSDYKLIGGGWKLNGQLNRETDKGLIEFNLNVQESHNNREAPANKYSWRATPSKNWGTLLGTSTSQEGGYGDIGKQQNTFTTNIHFKTPPFTNKTITHQINTGMELSYANATFDRTETAIESIAWLADGYLGQLVSCSSGDQDCINGEQFIYQKNIRPEDKAEANIFNFDAYIEDTISIKRVSLRPGLRVSYNNFQENTDLAPRLTSNIDIWGNNKTILTGGAGRYYNTNLLTLNLEEQKKPYERYRRSIFLVDGEPEAWPDEPLPRTSIPASRTTELKTPYSDEWSVGLQQKILGGQSEVLYINRYYKDQIISVIFDLDDGYVYKEWKNSGRRKYQELSLSWQKQWIEHFLSLNISWQKVNSNSSSYADQFNEDQFTDIPDYVWYDEELILREDLPPNNFNRPITASLLYTTQLPYGFSFTNTMNFKDRHKALTINGTDPSGQFDAYSVSSIPSTTIFDWKITWVSSEWKGNTLECSLDILNVFDRKAQYAPTNYLSSESDNYLIGRQFWAGLTYSF